MNIQEVLEAILLPSSDPRVDPLPPSLELLAKQIECREIGVSEALRRCEIRDDLDCSVLLKFLEAHDTAKEEEDQMEMVIFMEIIEQLAQDPFLCGQLQPIRRRLVRLMPSCDHCYGAVVGLSHWFQTPETLRDLCYPAATAHVQLLGDLTKLDVIEEPVKSFSALHLHFTSQNPLTNSTVGIGVWLRTTHFLTFPILEILGLVSVGVVNGYFTVEQQHQQILFSAYLLDPNKLYHAYFLITRDVVELYINGSFVEVLNFKFVIPKTLQKKKLTVEITSDEYQFISFLMNQSNIEKSMIHLIYCVGCNYTGDYQDNLSQFIPLSKKALHSIKYKYNTNINNNLNNSMNNNGNSMKKGIALENILFNVHAQMLASNQKFNTLLISEIIYSLGGISLLLKLVENSTTILSLINSITLLFNCINLDVKLSNEMLDLKGYDILATILKVKKKNNPSLVGLEILECILGFIGYNFNSLIDSIYINIDAYKSLIIELDIWKSMPPESESESEQNHDHIEVTSAASASTNYYDAYEEDDEEDDFIPPSKAGDETFQFLLFQYTVFFQISRYSDYNIAKISKLRLFKRFIQCLKNENFIPLPPSTNLNQLEENINDIKSIKSSNSNSKSLIPITAAQNKVENFDYTSIQNTLYLLLKINPSFDSFKSLSFFIIYLLSKPVIIDSSNSKNINDSLNLAITCLKSIISFLYENLDNSNNNIINMNGNSSSSNSINSNNITTANNDIITKLTKSFSINYLLNLLSLHIPIISLMVLQILLLIFKSLDSTIYLNFLNKNSKFNLLIIKNEINSLFDYKILLSLWQLISGNYQSMIEISNEINDFNDLKKYLKNFNEFNNNFDDDDDIVYLEFWSVLTKMVEKQVAIVKENSNSNSHTHSNINKDSDSNLSKLIDFICDLIDIIKNNKKLNEIGKIGKIHNIGFNSIFLKQLSLILTILKINTFKNFNLIDLNFEKLNNKISQLFIENIKSLSSSSSKKNNNNSQFIEFNSWFNYKNQTIDNDGIPNLNFYDIFIHLTFKGIINKLNEQLLDDDIKDKDDIDCLLEWNSIINISQFISICIKVYHFDSNSNSSNNNFMNNHKSSLNLSLNNSKFGNNNDNNCLGLKELRGLVNIASIILEKVEINDSKSSMTNSITSLNNVLKSAAKKEEEEEEEESTFMKLTSRFTNSFFNPTNLTISTSNTTSNSVPNSPLNQIKSASFNSNYGNNLNKRINNRSKKTKLLILNDLKELLGKLLLNLSYETLKCSNNGNMKAITIGNGGIKAIEEYCFILNYRQALIFQKDGGVCNDEIVTKIISILLYFVDFFHKINEFQSESKKSAIYNDSNSNINTSPLISSCLNTIRTIFIHKQQNLTQISSILANSISPPTGRTTGDNKHISILFDKLCNVILTNDNSKFQEWATKHGIFGILQGCFMSLLPTFSTTSTSQLIQNQSITRLRSRSRSHSLPTPIHNKPVDESVMWLKFLKENSPNPIKLKQILDTYHNESISSRYIILDHEQARYYRHLQDHEDDVLYYVAEYNKMKQELKRLGNNLNYDNDKSDDINYSLDYIEGKDRIRKVMIRHQELDEVLPYQVDVDQFKIKPSQSSGQNDSEQGDESTLVSNSSIEEQKPSKSDLLDNKQNNIDVIETDEDGFEIVSNSEPTDQNLIPQEDRNRKVLRSLNKSDTVNDLWNVSHVIGLEIVEGLLICGKTHLYLIDNYFHCKDGEIVDVENAPMEYRDSYLKLLSSIPANKHHSNASSDASSNSNSSGGSNHHNNPSTSTSASNEKIDPKNSQKILHKRRAWQFEGFVALVKRQFLLRDIGLELFFKNGSSLFITCLNVKHRDLIYRTLASKVLPSIINNPGVSLAGPIMGSLPNGGSNLKSFDEELSLVLGIINNQTIISQHSSIGSKLANAFNNSLNNNYNLNGILQITKKWQQGDISNFYYLMLINTLAGRTFNDLTQYPVFPWVIADYTSDVLDLDDPKTFRDLSKPMGAQTPNREAIFKERYEALQSLDDPNCPPPFHYGTHYSSAMIVTSFLIRLEPYVQSYLLLQGGKFDHADRLFYSVPKAWKSSSSEDNSSDVRELIPEFYYLP